MAQSKFTNINKIRIKNISRSKEKTDYSLDGNVRLRFLCLSGVASSDIGLPSIETEQRTSKRQGMDKHNKSLSC